MISAEEFDRRLLAIDPQAVDFEPQIDELLAHVDLSKLDELLRSVFKFFEKHPLENAGAPGALVHFAEHYYPSYKARLFASLSASPSMAAIIMANRILNSSLSPSERIEYLSALEEVVANPKASPIVQDRAQHFLAYQSARSA